MSIPVEILTGLSSDFCYGKFYVLFDTRPNPIRGSRAVLTHSTRVSTLATGAFARSCLLGLVPDPSKSLADDRSAIKLMR